MILQTHRCQCWANSFAEVTHEIVSSRMLSAVSESVQGTRSVQYLRRRDQYHAIRQELGTSAQPVNRVVFMHGYSRRNKPVATLGSRQF